MIPAMLPDYKIIMTYIDKKCIIQSGEWKKKHIKIHIFVISL